MSVRQDKVQISIAFLTDESKEYARLIQENKQFGEDIKKNIKSGKDLSGTVKDIAKSAEALSKIPLDKVAPTQLVDRAKQLQQVMKLIPQSAPEYRILETEYKKINDQLAEMRNRTKGVAGAMTQAKVESTGFAGKFAGVLGGVFGGFIGGGLVQGIVAATSAVFNFGKQAISSIDEGLKAEAQLRAALKSTQEVAGKSFDDLINQANELQKVTLFSDEQINQSEALLLTFTNIRGEIFDRTLPAVLDLSTAFKQDVSASSIQLGKALNDPIKGVTALQRVGVGFTEAQKDLIKSFVETNQVAKAQEVILKELETQVGGSAKAAAEAGLGPYQLLQKRLGEVQETIGRLIEKGLRRFQPVLEGIVTLVEGFVDSITSGEKATGRFSGAINFIIGVYKVWYKQQQIIQEVLRTFYEFVLQPVGNFLINTVAPAFTSVGNRVQSFIEIARGLPVIGTFFKVIVGGVNLLKEVFNNVPATFAGIRAAVRQVVENIKLDLDVIIINAKIAAKTLQAALSFDSDTKARLNKELEGLRSQRTTAAKSGKEVGEAYRDARNQAIQEARAQSAKEEAEEKKRQEAAGKNLAPGGGGGSKQELEKRQKEAEKARKEAFDLALKETEAFAAKEEVVLANQRQKDLISENDYQSQLLNIKKARIEDQLAVYKKFGEDQTTEAIKLQSDLLKIQQDFKSGQLAIGLSATNIDETDQKTFLERQRLEGVISEQQYQRRLTEVTLEGLRERLQVYKNFGQDQSKEALTIQNQILKAEIDLNNLIKEQDEKNAQEKIDRELSLIDQESSAKEQALFEKFQKALLTEQDYNRQLIEAKIASIDAEVAVLKTGGDKQLEQARALNDERIKLSKQLSDEEVKNEERTQAMKQKVQSAALGASQEFFQLGIDLLSRDEAARKKNAGAIKAFQTAQIIISGISEVQKIWAGAAELGPIAGPIIGGILTAVAVGRSVLAIGKIKNAQFSGGGPTGQGLWQDGTGHRVAGVVHDNEYVMPKWMVQDRSMQPVLQWIENRRVKGYASGGFVTDSTTPVPGAAGSAGAIQQQSEQKMDVLIAATLMVAEKISQMPTTLKANVVYTDIESAGSELDDIRQQAAI
jgi:hypothetical protein